MRRPLCTVLCLVVLWIILLYDPPDKEAVPARSSDEFIAQVEDMTGIGEDISLIVTEVTDRDGPFCDRLQLKASTGFQSKQRSCSFSHLKIGNIISFKGSIKPFREPGNPGQFNEKAYYRSIGIDARGYVEEVHVIDSRSDRIAMCLRRLRTFFCDAFYQTLPDREAGIITAMLLGEKSGLDEEIRELYRENGIIHILAISGLHVSLIGMGLFSFLKKTVLPMQAAAVVTGIVLFLYGELTGFSLATRRAVIMMIVLLSARILGERYDRLNALALAAIVELIRNPDALYQSGFLLSYGTVFGIILFVGEFGKLRIAPKNSLKQKSFDVISGALGVYFVTLPVLIQSYYELAVFSVPVNTLLLPLLSILIGMSLLGGAIALLSVYAAKLFMGAVYVILRLMETVCLWVDRIPVHILVTGHKSTSQVIFYYAVLALVTFFLKNNQKPFTELFQYPHRRCTLRKKTIAWIAVSVLFINAVILLRPVSPSSGNLSITNLDVGQGDCTLLCTPDDKTILIDGGSSDVSNVGKYRIVPTLIYRGISTIDLMVITHSDDDHVNGLAEILEKEDHFGLAIRQVIMPEINHADEAYTVFESLVKRAEEEEGIRLCKIKAGDRIDIGEVSMTCLHPESGYEWEDVNDYSTVLSLSFRDFRAIFTGDLGTHGEEEMLRTLDGKGEPPDVDYLKIGHHGSKNSSSEPFLSKIRPEVAVASAGLNNRYHHPSKEAVKRIQDAGAKVYCTIECGAVTTVTDGKTVHVETFKDALKDSVDP